MSLILVQLFMNNELSLFIDELSLFKFFLYKNIDDLTKTGLKKLLSIVK